jgi:type III secretory pathway lipoprotein EscJ
VSVDVVVVVDVVVDGDVNEFPGKKPSHVAVAVKVHVNVNVNVYVTSIGISGRELA